MNDTELSRHGERTDVSENGAERSSEQSSDVDECAPREFGGRKGPDPVRYGDWEKNGRCIDF